jgi:hypothetical protein
MRGPGTTKSLPKTTFGLGGLATKATRGRYFPWVPGCHAECVECEACAKDRHDLVEPPPCLPRFTGEERVRNSSSAFPAQRGRRESEIHGGGESPKFTGERVRNSSSPLPCQRGRKGGGSTSSDSTFRTSGPPSLSQGRASATPALAGAALALREPEALAIFVASDRRGPLDLVLDGNDGHGTLLILGGHALLRGPLGARGLPLEAFGHLIRSGHAQTVGPGPLEPNP